MKKKSKIVTLSPKPSKKRATRPYTSPVVQANIQLLRLQGKNISQIANELGIARDTARKFLDTAAQRAEMVEVQSAVVSMLREAVVRVKVEIADPMSSSGPVLAMKALESSGVIPNLKEMPAPPPTTTAGDEGMSQFDRDVKNALAQMYASCLRTSRAYGLPDPEILKEPETRLLEQPPAAVNVPLKR